jgi:hypothetical protein
VDAELAALSCWRARRSSVECRAREEPGFPSPHALPVCWPPHSSPACLLGCTMTVKLHLLRLRNQQCAC